MANSYYIMKMCESYKNNTDVYYSTLCKRYIKKPTSLIIGKYKCRVCWKKSDVSIYECKDREEVLKMLQNFTEVDITKDDDYTSLCHECYKFLKAGLAFKKLAIHSTKLLMQLKKSKTEDAVSPQLKSVSSCSDDEENLSVKEHSVPSENTTKKKKEENSIKVTCEICKKLVSKGYYSHHITIHDPNAPKNYVCDICGMKFRLRCAYYNHKRRHEPNFLHKCKLCPYRARYVELLKTHMKTHNGDYRYMCTDCPARFLFSSNLKRHMLMHKEPQFKCESCERGFHSKLYLERHIDVDHLGIKSHLCNICGKVFGYRSAMMKHQLHVHKREKRGSGRMASYLLAQVTNQDNVLFNDFK